MQPVDMRQRLALDPAPRLGQHLLRDIDAGHARIPPEIRQRQTGADAHFQDALTRALVDQAHRLLATGMKNRAENKIVRPGKQPIGPDRVAQVHRIVSRSDRRDRGGGRPPTAKVRPIIQFVNHRVARPRYAPRRRIYDCTETLESAPCSREAFPG